MKSNLDKCSETESYVNHKNKSEINFFWINSLPIEILEWMEANRGDVIVVWDSTGAICYVSMSVESLLGYTREELLGTQWYEKLSPKDISYIESHFASDSTHSNKTFNVNIQTSQGKSIWAECTASEIAVDNGNKIYYISALRDITAKKEVEDLLIRSEKMSIAGQLAAGIAHEIRNPLTSLKGFLQLLQAGVNRKDEYYKIMIDEIEKMETITSELLFISKPMTDHKQLESVEKMIIDVAELLKSQAKLKNIVIDWDVEGDQSIYCDRSQIKQVLINLVKNALEAMDKPGNIYIQSIEDKEQIRIDIRDEGTGIPQDIIHKLGEPFFTTKQNGTGLGLMITKQILQRHGAVLEIERNKECGSTFSIIFNA